MERVKHILLASIAARMSGDQSILVVNLHGKRVSFQGQDLARLFCWHRVAVGVVTHLTVRGQMGLPRDTTVKRPLGQRPKHRLFLLPDLPNGSRLAAHDSYIIVQALLKQRLIEVCIGLYMWHGY